MNFSATSPERMKFFIRNNIHMIWRELEHLPTGALQITFYKGSFPIVMQTLPQVTDRYVSENLWIFNKNAFKNILEFRDFVDAQKFDE